MRDRRHSALVSLILLLAVRPKLCDSCGFGVWAVETLMGSRFHVPNVASSLRLSMRGALQAESIT